MALEETTAAPVEKEGVLKQTYREVTQPFKDLFKASRALWGINISYLLEGLTYFGVVGLLVIYFNDFVGLNDIDAGHMVGVLTAGITLSMLFLGAAVDIIGIRKSLIWSLIFMLIGRILLTMAPGLFGTKGLWTPTHLMAMGGILGIVIGYGMYQPACYAAVKQFTTEKSSAMGYAMLYALMNLGGFLPAIVSPLVRERMGYGIIGVFWVYVALTVVGIGVIVLILTKKAIKDSTVSIISKSDDENGLKVFLDTLKQKIVEKKRETIIGGVILGVLLVVTILKEVYFKEAHFSNQILQYVFSLNWFYLWLPALFLFGILIITDPRFFYFILILIPVQTLFAHNWLTLPIYFSRAFTGAVSTYFDFFSNINPILIFVLTPMVAALTMERHAYKMMIIGTFVMASPTFILAIGPSITTVFAYLIIMTIGEAMWQPRFLQWVAEIAPKGMTGIYMGIGQFPWFLTKIVTSLYSGWFLMHYCPKGALPSQMNTQSMWLIYGFIAIISPIGLLLSRTWMMKGFKTKAE
jgi:MFS family permease